MFEVEVHGNAYTGDGNARSIADREFRALLTGYSNGWYSWNEVVANSVGSPGSPGSFITNIQGVLFGTTGVSPAYEANQQLAPLYTFVQMRRAYFDANLGDVYVFDRNSSSTGPPIAYPVVTGVCPQSPVLDKELSSADAEINSTVGVSLIVQTVTLTAAAKAVVSWVVNWGGHTGATPASTFTSYLTVNGSDVGADTPNSKRSVVTVPTAAWQWTQQYEVPVNLIAGANTITLKAKRLSVAGILFADRGTRLTIEVPSFLVQRQTFVMQGTGVGPQTCVSDPTDCCMDTGGIPSGDYGPLPIPCVHCVGTTPTRWSFTAAGFELCFFNGQSIDPNGDWELDQFDGCKWSGTLNGIEAELTSDSSGTGRVWTLTIGNAVYTLTQEVDPDDCCLPITLTAVDSPDGVFPCVEYPLTITLTPFCPDGSGGPHSGSGGGGDVSVPCCPDDLVPSVFVLNLSNGDSITLVWNGGVEWTGTGTICGHVWTSFLATCDIGTGRWKLSGTSSVDGVCLFTNSGLEADVHVCNPFHLHWTGIHFIRSDLTGDCCIVDADTTGPGPGGGGDGDPLVPCCSDKIPATLYATVASVSGCAAMASKYALKWVPAYQMWVFYSTTAVGGNGLALELMCDGSTAGSLLLSGVCDLTMPAFATNAVPVDGTCGPPVLLAFGPFAIATGCCTGSILVTVTTT